MARKTVTRTDITEALYRETRLSHGECKIILDETFEEIAKAMVSQDNVKLSGFGSFTVRQKKERIARNPTTGEPAVVTARKSILFKASPDLKRKVAAGSE